MNDKDLTIADVTRKPFDWKGHAKKLRRLVATNREFYYCKKSLNQ